MKRLLSSLLFGLLLPWIGISAALACLLFLLYGLGFNAVVVLWGGLGRLPAGIDRASRRRRPL